VSPWPPRRVHHTPPRWPTPGELDATLANLSPEHHAYTAALESLGDLALTFGRRAAETNELGGKPQDYNQIYFDVDGLLARAATSDDIES
jgi:hypothetical protein